MRFLSDTDKQQIAEAIRVVEKNTAGELVTVIARRSDDYFFIPLLWASLLALTVPGLVLLLQNDWLLAHSYMVQFISFFVLAVVFRWPTLTMKLIPRHVKYQRAHRLAMEQYFAQNLHHTQQRTGVLIFVSVAEHYVEVIADKGINDVVSSNHWNTIVQEFVERIKAGKVRDGFIEAINGCGQVLSEHFPVSEHDKNELPNHLIEL